MLIFFFNDTTTTQIYTLSLHDALPISSERGEGAIVDYAGGEGVVLTVEDDHTLATGVVRSEEHTSELQSLAYLVCRLLLEKKKTFNHSNLSNLAKFMTMITSPIDSPVE